MRETYAHFQRALTDKTDARFHAARALWENRIPDERSDEREWRAREWEEVLDRTFIPPGGTRVTRPPKAWKVLPHGKLTQLDDNLLTVTGELHAPMALPRRMTVARLNDLRLVVFSAIALNQKEMAILEAFGHPAFLIVPNDKHRLDARSWKLRYPSIQVIAPEGSRVGVQKRVPVDTVTPAFDDPNVQFFTVPGTGEKEAALLVHSSKGSTLVLNDLVGNIRNASGFGGWLLRKAGFAGDQPQIPRVVKMALIKDSDALRAQLLQWSEIETLKRIVVSHGSRIAENPREVLRVLARSLEAPAELRVRAS